MYSRPVHMNALMIKVSTALGSIRHYNFLTLALGALFTVLVVLVCQRIVFPWDMLMWAESPFMTSMLKLHNGSALFTSPADANSFVYSPGLEYLSYALLSPLSLELDIRYLRAVNTLIGLLAALVLAIAAKNICKSGYKDAEQIALLPGFLLFALIIFKNFTADVTHPDNLHVLHFGLTFCLAGFALLRHSFGFALLAVAIAGLGVWSKQVAFGAIFGVLAAFFVAGQWNRRQQMVLLSVGAGVTIFSVAALLVPDLSRLYLLELLSQHSIKFSKIPKLLTDWVIAPHHLILTIGAVWCLKRFWVTEIALRPYLVLWLALGVTEVLPSLSAYFKVLGEWNNLTIIDVWLALCLAPAFPLILKKTANGKDRSRRKAHVFGAVLILSLFPLKKIPGEEIWKYCRDIQTSVSADIESGNRIYVGHGAMFLINAGDTSVPMDRLNSLLELRLGKDRRGEAAFNKRIKQKYYDSAYINIEWIPIGYLYWWSSQYRVESTVEAPLEELSFADAIQPQLYRGMMILRQRN